MKDKLQAIALGACLVLIAVALTASGTFGAGPARAFSAEPAAAPVPATPELTPDQVKLPGRPDRPPVTCGWLRQVGAGLAWRELYGCWPTACLRDQLRRVERRAYRAARKGTP